jgi:hypothetical protein
MSVINYIIKNNLSIFKTNGKPYFSNNELFKIVVNIKTMYWSLHFSGAVFLLVRKYQ